MRVLRSSFPVFFALVTLVACGDDNENQDADGARSLLSQVQAEDYPSWERAPGWPTRTPSSAPHGVEVEIYVNDLLAAVLEEAAALTAWPEGSTIVKDGFRGGNLALTAIMDKRSDGWYWAEYDADGEPLYSGRPATCTDCHSIGDDFVRAFAFP